eukprot:363542-Chlamydomonas_euryale.AAC.5
MLRNPACAHLKNGTTVSAVTRITRRLSQQPESAESRTARGSELPFLALISKAYSVHTCAMAHHQCVAPAQSLLIQRVHLRCAAVDVAADGWHGKATRGETIVESRQVAWQDYKRTGCGETTCSQQQP